MSDPASLTDLKSLWKNQPLEESSMDVQQFVARRTQELHASTRSDILMSIAAVVFFVGILLWRINVAPDHLRGFGLTVVIAWILISVYRFRTRILRRVSPALSAITSTGLECYRQELERRRDHLKSLWLWHGPVLVACVLSLAAFSGSAFPGMKRLQNAAPLVFLLLIWTAFSIRRRWYQAMQIQREIDDIETL
jgi:hypothetical protein